MINNFVRNDEDAEEPEELNDEEATLADDLLDEVGADESDDVGDSMEGFGILPESDDDEDEEEKNEDDQEEDAELEDDAEDVDFDTFDDVDEL